jgi:hypothetical protein
LQTPETKKQISFFNIDTGAIKLPYFDERYNLKIKLWFHSIKNFEHRQKVMNCILTASLLSPTKNQPSKIARKDVLIRMRDLTISCYWALISVDSSSTLNLNKIKFKTYAKYDTNSDTIYSLKVWFQNESRILSPHFLMGYLPIFKGMNEGTFDYKLDFKFNKTNQNN